MNFKQEKQKAFNDFAADVMAAETTPENAAYQSVISTVYTLIEANRLDEVLKALQDSFPEYWHPDTSKEEKITG